MEVVDLISAVFTTEVKVRVFVLVFVFPMTSVFVEVTEVDSVVTLPTVTVGI